jgi:hypothetical protein
MRPSTIRPPHIRALFLVFALACAAVAQVSAQVTPLDTPQVVLPYPITDPPGTGDTNTGTIDLENPDNVTNNVVYDPVTGQYIMQSTHRGQLRLPPAP